MGFLGRMFSGAKRFLGKVKGGLGFGLRLFDKIKGGYEAVKRTVANLPVVGTAAAELISQGETAAGKFFKERTGIDPSVPGRIINVARTVDRYLPE
jgi:hypothetical protein